MAECRVCHKVFHESQFQCPRCGFRETAVIGDLAHAENINNSKAIPHRVRFLDEFDFGVVTHYWKDDNGTVVPDREATLSFGQGGKLLGREIWLNQLFARIPDTARMELDLRVLRGGKEYRRLSVSLNVPRGAFLQQVGIALTEDMKVSLLLKNEQEQTRSTPVGFLND